MGLPAVATIIMCEDIREEFAGRLVERFGWTKRYVALTQQQARNCADAGATRIRPHTASRSPTAPVR
jgi:hypothetical protein